jgi:subtilisin family serine protease
MFTVRYGGKGGGGFALGVSDAHVVVRTQSRAPAASRSPVVAAVPLSREARSVLGRFDVQVRFPSAGVEVLRTRDPRGDPGLRDAARAVLNAEDEVRFAGRTLITPAARPVVYTENLFVKFRPELSPFECDEILSRHGLEVKRRLGYAQNAVFAGAPEGTGLKVFDVADALLDHPAVELCHPELVREARERAIHPAQWHLQRAVIGGRTIDQHVDVQGAWRLADGRGTVIAILDDGIDTGHEEFSEPGKIVAPRDFERDTFDPRPGPGDNHGTACAGVACASGRFGASGVAPGARLMPIRMPKGALGSQREADAFAWAADHGADVISCSWGPMDGAWYDPRDPLHDEVVPLPDSTRLAIDYATSRGRGGKGSVVLFAAGNGNESVDNDGYASYPRVVAVAACNDRGTRSVYSDFGRAVWCSFPSSDLEGALTPGIWTTDRRGANGYNPGGTAARGDAAGSYCNDFGGTSSSCPGAAGVAALVISRNPQLRGDQVRAILKAACAPIDTAGRSYDADGHSPFYGFGRLNARRAVELATAGPRPNVTVRSARREVRIPDLGIARINLPVQDTSRLRALRVGVDLQHGYLGDLVVTLRPPRESGMSPIVLHNREGGPADNLRRTYDTSTTPALAQAAGRIPRGEWVLEVADRVVGDEGILHGFFLELNL